MRVHFAFVLIALGCSEPPPPVVEIQNPPRASPAPANIVVDDRGTRVEAGGALVEADERGAHVSAGNAEVRADDEGVVIGAGNTRIRVDDQGVSIPGLGRIAAPQGMTNNTPSRSSNAIVCNASDRLIRNNVVLSGGALPAITASGSCEVICNNCTIRSNAVAIVASGSSRITLNGGTVTGRVAIAGSGSTQITTNGTQTRGAVTRSGNAEIRQH